MGNPVVEAHLWADKGLNDAAPACDESLMCELRTVPPENLPAAAFAFIRAAYGKGYTDGLRDPEPLKKADAGERALILSLTL